METPLIKEPEFPFCLEKTDIKFIEDKSIVFIKWKDNDKEISIPLWFWLDLTSYEIDVNTALEKYKTCLESINVQ